MLYICMNAKTVYFHRTRVYGIREMHVFSDPPMVTNIHINKPEDLFKNVYVPFVFTETMLLLLGRKLSSTCFISLAGILISVSPAVAISGFRVS